MTSTLRKTSVDLSGLMRVLGEALYSTPHVAIRELVQNAHDSCTRRRLEADGAPEPHISVTTAPGTLTISDNGAGLTFDEIHSYLATVGSGYTRVLREHGNDELIGYFGLGFLSAFTVSELVEVWTCSYREPQMAHRFVSRSGQTYSVETAPARPVGTEVRLTLRSEFEELDDAAVVMERLRRYCCLLKVPISLNGAAPVNQLVPPWRLTQELSALRRRSLSLEFARRFETTFEPITTIAVTAPEHGVAGVLWIQDGSSYGGSDNRNIAVFVRGMLVGEDERELLPRWAGFVGGVIENDALHPTASRESLQDDEVYRHTAAAIRKCLVAGLAALSREEVATWHRVLLRHNEALLGAALVDETLFALVADEVTVPTTEGDLTLPKLLERSADQIHITQSERPGLESMLLRTLRKPVVLGNRYAALPFCQHYSKLRRGQLVVLGTKAGEAALFKPATLPAGSTELLESSFAGPGRQVLVRRFEPPFLPFVLLTDRDAELKQRLESDEANRRIGQGVLALARQFTQGLTAGAPMRLYVNESNPIVCALLTATPERRTQAVALLQPIAALIGDAEHAQDLEVAMQTCAAVLLTLLQAT